MATTIGGSYEYNGLCQSCGFKKKFSELRKRWDGFWVCEADWEPRHPSDFYRNRDDSHRLPITLPDDNNGIDVGPAINSATHTTTPTPVSGL